MLNTSRSKRRWPQQVAIARCSVSSSTSLAGATYTTPTPSRSRGAAGTASTGRVTPGYRRTQQGVPRRSHRVVRGGLWAMAGVDRAARRRGLRRTRPVHWHATAPLWDILVMVTTHWGYHAGEINQIPGRRAWRGVGAGGGGGGGVGRTTSPRRDIACGRTGCPTRRRWDTRRISRNETPSCTAGDANSSYPEGASSDAPFGFLCSEV